MSKKLIKRVFYIDLSDEPKLKDLIEELQYYLNIDPEAKLENQGYEYDEFAIIYTEMESEVEYDRRLLREAQAKKALATRKLNKINAEVAEYERLKEKYG